MPTEVKCKNCGHKHWHSSGKYGCVGGEGVYNEQTHRWSWCECHDFDPGLLRRMEYKIKSKQERENSFDRAMWSSWAESEMDLMPEKMRKEYSEVLRRKEEHDTD